MSTNRHTAVAAGAAATAATINTPLGQLDSALTPVVVEASGGTVATTVTTAGTYYAVTGMEVSINPSFTGQVFDVALVLGGFFGGAAGTSTLNVRVVDSVNATITEFFFRGVTVNTTQHPGGGGNRYWTAAAGDVGVVRKFKAYVTHTVNGTQVNTNYWSLQAVAH